VISNAGTTCPIVAKWNYRVIMFFFRKLNLNFLFSKSGKLSKLPFLQIEPESFISPAAHNELLMLMYVVYRTERVLYHNKYSFFESKFC